MRCALLAGVLGACSFEPGVLPGGDAQPADTSADALVLGPWGTPTVIALAPPTDTDDDPTLTGDVLEMYINSARAGNADVYVTTRAALTDAWSMPVVVPLVSSNSNETTPEVSADGLSLIIASDRVGTAGGNDLWLSTRSSRADVWGLPVVISELSGPTPDTAGNMTPDGRLIVFSSQRINGSPDLFTAERAGASGTWNAPIEAAALNTIGHEGSPCLSADGLTVYFDTDRGGNLDIYISRRMSRSDPFPAPVPVVEIDTADSEQDPWVSPDGRRLLFSSNRGGANQLWEATR